MGTGGKKGGRRETLLEPGQASGVDAQLRRLRGEHRSFVPIDGGKVGASWEGVAKELGLGGGWRLSEAVSPLWDPHRVRAF